MVVLAASCALTGCGAGVPPLDLGRLGSRLVTAQDIEAQPAGSPQRAFVRWWRDVQYQNLTGYLDGFAPAVRRTIVRQGLAQRDLSALGPSLRGSLPQVLSVRLEGDRALLVVEVRSREQLRGYRYRVVASSPQELRFARIAGGWRLGDDAFVRGQLGEG